MVRMHVDDTSNLEMYMNAYVIETWFQYHLMKMHVEMHKYNERMCMSYGMMYIRT